MVLSCSFLELERLTHPEYATYGLGSLKTYGADDWVPDNSTSHALCSQ